MHLFGLDVAESQARKMLKTLRSPGGKLILGLVQAWEKTCIGKWVLTEDPAEEVRMKHELKALKKLEDLPDLLDGLLKKEEIDEG